MTYEYKVARASADLRDAILKCLGHSAPIRLPGPPRQRAKPRAPVAPRTTYRVQRCGKVETIKKAVAEYYGVDLAALTGPRGNADISSARMVAMYLSRETGQSFPRIGWLFNRDHTTVMHACREVTRLIAEDLEYADDLEEIRAICDELSDPSPEYMSPPVGGGNLSEAYPVRWNDTRTELAA